MLVKTKISTTIGSEFVAKSSRMIWPCDQRRAGVCWCPERLLDCMPPTKF